MVLMVITVSLTFGNILFFPPHGLRWDIRVLGGFFHHDPGLGRIPLCTDA
jgi:hypothetical protein